MGDGGRKVGPLETGREQRGRPAHDLAQLRLTQRRHVDLAMRGIERLVSLQVTNEVGPHAHHYVQTRVGKAFNQYLRETPTRSLFGSYVKLLALIDVEEKCWRLRLTELIAVACARCVQQVAKGNRCLAELAHPTGLDFRSPWINRIELPGANERFDQRSPGRDARFELEKAPVAALLEHLRPRARSFSRTQPCLTH